MAINHSQLRSFHAVASEGSFTRAAAALHVTQPTISAQVKELEDGFGVKLFERMGRGVRITELGRALLEITRRQFGLEQEAEQLLAAARGLLRGELRVGADGPYHIIPLISSFTRRYPGIRISFAFGNSRVVLESLRDRLVDIAVLADLKPDERLHAVPLRRDRLVLFVERSHPWCARRGGVRLRELAGQRIVLREVGSTTRARFEQAVAEAGVALGETIEIGSREAVREAVAAGLGIGIVFESEFGHDDRLRRVAIRDARIESTEYAACLKERLPVRVVGAFFDLLAKGDGG
ncbi:MAG TPA: LysR substrate-binding domain-containing protein [Alphaproteobacteria bacterium]|nr:LysR substrate-binding domain-containing protein [Alphaproteobacteria bacterium]